MSGIRVFDTQGRVILDSRANFARVRFYRVVPYDDSGSAVVPSEEGEKLRAFSIGVFEGRSSVPSDPGEAFSMISVPHNVSMDGTSLQWFPPEDVPGDFRAAQSIIMVVGYV